jgi:predicted nucleic acid-binding protein
MTAPEFLDTNILEYAYDSSDARKQKIAQNLLRHALAGKMAISIQVLPEFSVTLLHKIYPVVSPETLLDVLATLAPIGSLP